MGEAKRRKSKTQELISNQPFCIFCGGSSAATTTEHCPPRSLFLNRNWPEGYEFPACTECNRGTSHDDAVVAMMARMSPDNSGNKDGQLQRVVRGVMQKIPDLPQKLRTSASEARKLNREIGVEPPPGMTHRDMGVALIPDEFFPAVNRFSNKLARAAYYKETGKIFPTHGCILMNWSTNATWIKHGTNVVFDILSSIPGSIPKMERARKSLHDQFSYKVSLEGDRLMILQAQFSYSFSLAIFASSVPGQLEAIAESIHEKTSRDGSSFELVHSPQAAAVSAILRKPQG